MAKSNPQQHKRNLNTGEDYKLLKCMNNSVIKQIESFKTRYGNTIIDHDFLEQLFKLCFLDGADFYTDKIQSINKRIEKFTRKDKKRGKHDSK